MSGSSNNKINIVITTGLFHRWIKASPCQTIIVKVSRELIRSCRDIADKRGLSLCATLKQAFAEYVEAHHEEAAPDAPQTPCEREDG